MSNELKDWINEAYGMTKKDRIKEDLYYEYNQYYNKDLSKFMADTLDILSEMAETLGLS